ncbi:MAG: SDR family oxidoreductase [Bacteroidia bacterium]
MTTAFQQNNYWALILGGSRGMGLATARKLAREGMNICVIHRDRRADLPEIEKAFQEIQGLGVHFLSKNINALQEDGVNAVLDELKDKMGEKGKIRLLFHSIARGNLKPLVAGSSSPSADSLVGAGVEDEILIKKWAELKEWFSPVDMGQQSLSPEDFQITIYAMATSLITWTRQCLDRNLFAADARIIGLTSEGNQRVWPGYAAVSAAKSVLESLAHSMAVEFAHLGIRTNLIQAGVTDTYSLRMIPEMKTSPQRCHAQPDGQTHPARRCRQCGLAPLSQ